MVTTAAGAVGHLHVRRTRGDEEEGTHVPELVGRVLDPMRIRPYQLQTNGKVERFQCALANEWAYAIASERRAPGFTCTTITADTPHSATAHQPAASPTSQGRTSRPPRLTSWAAMTLRWISLVPSPTIISGASRK